MFCDLWPVVSYKTVKEVLQHCANLLIHLKTLRGGGGEGGGGGGEGKGEGEERKEGAK